jgi:hypothetical protein
VAGDSSSTTAGVEEEGPQWGKIEILHNRPQKFGAKTHPNVVRDHPLALPLNCK